MQLTCTGPHDLAEACKRARLTGAALRRTRHGTQAWTTRASTAHTASARRATLSCTGDASPLARHTAVLPAGLHVVVSRRPTSSTTLPLSLLAKM